MVSFLYYNLNSFFSYWFSILFVYCHKINENKIKALKLAVNKFLKFFYFNWALIYKNINN